MAIHPIYDTTAPVTLAELEAFFELAEHADVDDPETERLLAGAELPTDDEEFAAGPGERS